MTSPLDLFHSKREFFEGKNVQQVVKMCGDGRLRDGSKASQEFRDLLASLPSAFLTLYVANCLKAAFEDSGEVLQDVINEVGRRLGYTVEAGRYRGSKNAIGFDGIWTAEDGHSLVIEVKTTDSYAIRLDNIAGYRKRLIESATIAFDKSSVLIVVGREDSGNLEAQIRGSRHAWDIRLISADALLRLMRLKEDLNETSSITQIRQILKPIEYTRLDWLVDLIEVASQDVKADAELGPTTAATAEEIEVQEPRAAFHEQVIEVVSKSLKVALIRDARTKYRTADSQTRIICAVSKTYGDSEASAGYWYALHPHQVEYLEQGQTAYFAFGCGGPSRIALLPLSFIKSHLAKLNKTVKPDRIYWHVILKAENGKMAMVCSEGIRVDISDHVIGSE
jgi:hypothetical protein